jgi:hypothetical protein
MKRTLTILLALGLALAAQRAQADWTPAKRLTWTSGFSFGPAVAMDSSDAIHLVWTEDTSGNYEIYYKKSTNGGASWAASRRLTWNSGYSYSPAIAIDSAATLHVIWHDTTPGYAEIYYRSSTDEGVTWSAVRRLTWTSGKSYNPAIAITTNNRIHVVWEDGTPGNVEIYHKKSMDGGATWSPTRRLTWTSGDSYEPAIAIDSNNKIHVVWKDDTPGQYELYYKRSTDGGTNWSSTQRLTWISADSSCPAMAVHSTNAVHIVWHVETPAGLEIYYMKSEDGGADWSAARRLTWTSSSSSYPDIAVGSTNAVHVVWQEAYIGGNDEIHYRKSWDGGASWNPVQRLTWIAGWSNDPALTIDSADTIHVVWRDDPTGNVEIYYKRSQ